MTSGTVGGASPGPSTLGHGFRRVWSGADGKVTTFAGTQREKWNNYTCTYESWDRSFLGVKYRRWNEKYQPSTGEITVGSTTVNPGFGFGAPLLWGANDQLKLLSRLLAIVKSHDFDLGVNLATAHQTVDLVVGNLQKLGRAALALKRGQFATAARQLGVHPRGTRLKSTDVSGRWLELQYGWLPLIGDSYEAAKAYHAITANPRSQIYRSSNSIKGLKDGSQSPTVLSLPYTEKVTRYIQYECVEQLSVARQLGLLDPLSVAWEILPWSFVIDWFIPIGNYLDLLGQIPQLQGRFLTTEVRKREFSQEGAGLTGHYWDLVGAGYFGYHLIAILQTPTFRHKLVEMSRTYSTSLSVPLPDFAFAGAVHGSRIWNAISLAQQRFARSFR
jgi:hypothetical protein